jgi:hypothetical protein
MNNDEDFVKDNHFLPAIESDFKLLPLFTAEQIVGKTLRKNQNFPTKVSSYSYMAIFIYYLFLLSKEYYPFKKKS